MHEARSLIALTSICIRYTKLSQENNQAVYTTSGYAGICLKCAKMPKMPKIVESLRSIIIIIP